MSSHDAGVPTFFAGGCPGPVGSASPLRGDIFPRRDRTGILPNGMGKYARGPEVLHLQPCSPSHLTASTLGDAAEEAFALIARGTRSVVGPTTRGGPAGRRLYSTDDARPPAKPQRSTLSISRGCRSHSFKLKRCTLEHYGTLAIRAVGRGGRLVL